MTTATEPISARLRTSTQQLHTTAEQHPLQQAMIRGSLSKAQYTAFLGQMLFVHECLEKALRAAAQQCESLGHVVHEHAYQAPRLRDDLQFFGVDPAALSPTQATQTLCQQIKDKSASAPAALLGFFYVLEGSNNGSKFIAKAIRPAFGLTGEQGVSFLNPYGDRQSELWSQFKVEIDAEEFTPEQQQGMIDAACAMFEAISAIGDDLITLHPIKD